MPQKDEGNTSCCLCRVEWAMWGNINALFSGVCIFTGAVIAASIPEIAIDDPFPTNAGSAFRWINLFIGLLVFVLEYPRSARRSKTNVERPGQSLIAPILHNIKFFGSNYIVRFLFYLFLMIPCFFVLPTIFGGMTLFCSCCCYFAAALNGESWKAPSLAWGPGKTKKKDTGPRIKEIPDAPSEPPPRPPPQAQHGLEAPPSSPPPKPTS